MINILVTGGNGQLAKCIKDLDSNSFNFIYTDYTDLDITNLTTLEFFFNNYSIDYCINCAAYTAVDQAENDEESAYKVNELGVKNLSTVCKKHQVTLIHISTDFVFNGNQSRFYNEQSITHPINVYGASKLQGEQHIQRLLEKYFIIRTSWLYSEHGNNFMKTMVKLSKEKSQISVVVDQIGSPTYAIDLASTIIQIISSKNQNYGVYHFSNEGVSSWYDFAKAIFEEIKSNIKLLPIKSSQYPTPAKRPQFSVLDKTKIKNVFQIEIPYWRDSLRRAIKNYYE